VSRREIIESGLFSGKEDLIMGLPSTEGNNDRASELTHGPGTLSDSAAEQELVELIDLYYPRRGTIVTVAGGSDPTGDVLGEQDWIGDERGPYSMLGFYWAPDNPMPVPLVSFLVDADHAANTIAVKTIDNARARKSFVLTDQRNPDMGQTIRDIGNGQVAEVPDPSRAQQFTLGGDNVSLYNDLGMLGEWISRLGGNTDLLGGLTADSGTATQDQILLHSSGIRVADMRAQLHEMYSELARKIAWYSFNTDAINETVTVTIPGGVQVNARIGPDKIVGEFDTYSFKVSTYSNAPESPDEEYQSLVEFLQTVVMPLLPVAAAQGADIDAAEVMIKAARARGIEGFGQMIRPAQEQGMPDVQQGPQAGGDQMTINAGSRPSPQPQQMQDSEVA
jgi:hypothetical protein